MRASTSKRLWTFSVFLLCIFLAFTPGNANALPSAEGSFNVGWSITGDLTFPPDIDVDGLPDMYGSSSEAKVEIDPDGPIKSYTIDREKVEAAGDTEANAYNNPVAEAHVYTNTIDTENKVGAMAGSAYAEGQVGIKNKAKSEAKQWMYFSVEHDTTLELTMDYYFTELASFDAVDQWVKAESKLEWEIGKWSLEFDEEDNVKLDKDGNVKIKKDKDSKVDNDITFKWEDLSGDVDETKEDSITISYEFKAGDLGYVKLTAKNKAEAEISTVPEPATMLLIGAGLICLAGLRRKFRQ